MEVRILIAKQLRPISGLAGSIIFLTGLLFWLNSPFVIAGDVETSPGPVVSLSYESKSEALFVAYDHTLYQVNTKSLGYRLIPLPNRAKHLSAVLATGPEALFLTSPDAGVLYTSDRGETWHTRNKGLSGKDITGLIRHSTQPNTLYAAQRKLGIFRSENSGNKWVLMDGGPENMNGLLIHTDMPDSMKTGWIFAGTTSGVSRSMDCFCLWRQAGSLPGNITGLSYDPAHPSHIYAAVKQDIYRSENGGEDWIKMGSLNSAATALVFTSTGALIAGTLSGNLFIKRNPTSPWEPFDAFKI
jgi:hypothetical protein